MLVSPDLLVALPEALRPHVDHQLALLADAVQERAVSVQLDTVQQQQLVSVLAASDYVAAQLQRHPQVLADLLASGDLHRSYADNDYAQRLQAALASISDDATLSKTLRQIRRREMIRIIWRDTTGLARFQETALDLSRFADACIDQTLQKVYGFVTAIMGTPRYKHSGEPMPMVVLGMGKLGAKELNLSSDIDLMFAYAHEGETQGGPRSVDHREFFLRLGQRLIKMLDENTAEGFVFRVDMRLRPFGNSGPLALSFAGMENYYEEQGREWERYAMIKARDIGSDNGDGARLLDALRPFIYRRYVDFGVIESLRELKNLINQEVLRRGKEDNVKTGAGGIREIEFIAQVFQLIRGGQEPDLQQRNLLTVLNVIRDLELLPHGIVKELRDDYVFLRNIEHRIQALQDRQTQLLPGDDFNRLRIAHGLGFASSEAFYSALEQTRARVRTHFANLIADSNKEEQEQVRNQAVDLWMQTETEADGLQDLTELGFRDPQTTWHLLSEMKSSKQVTHLQAVARERLDKLMPLLINACALQEDPDLSFQRVLQLVDAIRRRSAYMALLVENPQSLQRLAMLFQASPWVADTMCRYPVLLDQLLNEATLLKPLTVDVLQNELRQLMLRVPEDDLERQMDTLRQFKNAHVLRVAASELAGTLPLMKVSDYLTWLAETLLQTVFELAWRQMTEKHGIPQKAPGVPCDPDFIIVGYGKVGGLELSYSSDLDLVFIHDAHPALETDGSNPVDNTVFFARLGQRIIHILTTRMASGELYEVDMRLRPSGNSGLLVSSLNAFRTYQEEEAWTWEHQALVRARVVAGCSRLKERFEAERHAILAKHRDPATLAKDVRDMRAKMLANLSTHKQAADLDEALLSADHEFDLKQDPGGIVDIEFMAQFLALRWSGEKPALAKWTDNMRIFDEARDAGLLTVEDASDLQNAYLLLRSESHRRALQNASGKVSADQFAAERRRVRAIWHKVLT